MYCSKCGQYSNENRAVFCPLCGEKIVAVTEDKIKTLELQKNDPSLYSGYNTVSEENTSQDSFTESSANSVDSSAGVLPLAKQLIGKANKKYLTIGALVVAVIAVISVFSYLNSAAFIEKRLTKNTWFMVPVNTSYCYEGGAIKFYPNGDCEIWNTKAYEAWKWSGWYPDDEEWEIMKDKTLKIDDEYYDWNTDWRISGDSLTIGNKHYSLNDNCNYREELDIN